METVIHPYKVRVYPTEHFFHQNCWALVQNKPIYMSAKNRPLQPHTASRRGAYEHGRDRASKAVADRVPQGCEYDVLYRVFQSKPKVAMSVVPMGELPRAQGGGERGRHTMPGRVESRPDMAWQLVRGMHVLSLHVYPSLVRLI